MICPVFVYACVYVRSGSAAAAPCRGLAEGRIQELWGQPPFLSSVSLPSFPFPPFHSIQYISSLLPFLVPRVSQYCHEFSYMPLFVQSAKS